MKKQTKQYYEANKDKITEQSKQYYEANKYKITEYQKQYNEVNKNERNEKAKDYYRARKLKKLIIPNEEPIILTGSPSETETNHKLSKYKEMA